MVHNDGRVHLVDPAAGQTVGKPLEHIAEDGVRDAIRSVSFCPASKHLLTRSYRARAIWSAQTGALIDLLFNSIGVQVSRFSPSGNWVLAGTNFNSGQVWGLSGQLVLPKPLLHGSQLWGISANRDDTAIVSASYDRSARLWDTATGKQLGPPMLHAQGVCDALFSPDGTQVLTGSWDGTARLWPVPKPLPDDVPRISAWVETLTGLRLPAKGSLNGVVVFMKADEWKAHQTELEKLGGPFPLGK